MTDKQIAQALGMTDAALRYYRGRGCAATTPAGVKKWRDKNIAGNGPPTLAERAKGGKPKRATLPAEPLEIEELRAKVRKLTAEAEERELKIAQRRGELYEAADVESDVSELTGMIRARLESIPDELHQEWPPELREQVTARMKERIYLILTAMAQWSLSSWFADPDEPASES